MKLTKKQLKQIIKEELAGGGSEFSPEVVSFVPLQEYDFPLVPYPPQNTPEGMLDLEGVIMQYRNRFVPAGLQESCDSDVEGLFERYLGNKGETYNTEYFKRIRLDLLPMIKKLKDIYDRPRPSEVAADLGLDFESDHLESAQSPSYPSGHTIQAYVIALLLGDQFPEYFDDLLAIAEVVSQSRVDRGVHFPSDIDYGKLCAAVIYLGMT